MPDILSSTSDPSGIRRVLDRHPRLMQLGAALAMYEGGEQFVRQAKTFVNKHMTYTVVVNEDDRIYDAVLDWLMTLIPEGRQRNLVASSSLGTRFGNAVFEGDPEEKPKAELRVYYADNQTIVLDVDGHRVRATFNAIESTKQQKTRPDRSVTFACRTESAQRAILRHLETINDEKAKTDPTLWMTGMWGDWQRRSDLPLRRLDSVVIPPVQKEYLVEDLRAFLDAEQRYNELAIPWHRGYMFHGPPGTGKTSLAKALATEFRMDLWYISLADLKESSDLLSLLRSVRPRSILLLEDIDIAQFTHDRDSDAGKGLSMASLLNALDGVGTPHGLITIMTTNHLEKLDDALTRPGRMDRIEMIGLPGPAEVEELYRLFYGEALGERLPADHGLSQAEVSEILKRHLNDPVGGRRALVTTLRSAALAARR